LIHGSSIITADKTVLALEYDKVTSYASRKGLFIGYRATVAAGTPVLDVARGLRARDAEYIRAILNSTTNHILTLIEKGLTYRDAVEKAVEEKLAEPDPRIDTHGYDPGAKLAILLSELGYTKSLNDVIREPLEEISEEEVKKALSRNHTYKYIVEAYIKDKKYIVHLIELERTDPLANIKGIINRVAFFLEGEK
jgi:homoserine dehydrogenase